MAATQPKIEKKIMDDKVSKVREVVKNVSTNDIILALHNYELDVERTIHAFCEGGFETALGDWERTGAAKKRNHKKKPKNVNAMHQLAGNIPNNNKDTSGTTTPSVASSTTYSNGFSANFPGKLPLSNGDHHLPVDLGLATTNNPKENLELNGCPASATFFIDQNNHQPVNDELGRKQAPSPPNVTLHPATLTDDFATLKCEFDNSFGLVDYQSHLEQNRVMFEREIATAKASLCQCFKEVRDALTIREQQLLAELTKCQSDGFLYFESRKSVLQSLIAESALAKNNKSFVSKLEKFNGDKTEDLEAALTSRFLYDNSSHVSSISQLGKVVPIKYHEPVITTNDKNNGGPSKSAAAVPLAPAVEKTIKRSNSPSSLVSSIGEDSGLGGQISPVNQEKGQTVQVEENGIVLKSDSVSADQLAEIQRQIAESLRAKGIDPSVLSDINSSVARRRPPPNQPVKNGVQSEKMSGKGGSAPGAGGQPNNKASKPRQKQQQTNGGEKRK